MPYHNHREQSHAWLRAKDHDDDVNGHERDERAEVELAAEHGGHDLAAEREEGVAEVAQRGEWLAIPGDVGEPREEHADEQHLPVHPQPPHHRRHRRGHRRPQRREVDAPQADLQRRERGQQPAHAEAPPPPRAAAAATSGGRGEGSGRRARVWGGGGGWRGSGRRGGGGEGGAGTGR